ncbi:MAG: asparagine synthase (glutamine-hydrolyzing), partial [Nitratireductor sp.]
MCGFAGFIDINASTSQDALERLAETMVDQIRYRGPDAGGVWADAAAGFAMGFRRLAIVDLSAAGNQPMVSASGRNVIAYNGETYNTGEIRADLEALGVRFRGHSDTEVVLEACEAWGVEEAVARMNGMFAFALWDRRERHLQLVRDRVGIKPLYWGRLGGTIFFGSQSKSFAVHPAWRTEIDREALAAYFQFGYVPSPLSVFRGIRQLEPGHIVSLKADGATRHTVYWDARAVAEAGQGDLSELAEQDAVEELDVLLRDAVKRRLVADVPLGAFLSGGIDSSTVVALMQAQSTHQVKTFSIGFRESDYDEAGYAKAIAGHLGTDHTELYVDAAQARNLVPALAQWYDEPFADSSQIPTLLVSQLARRSVTVSLSGDGGDELFAGYNRYALGEMIWRRFGGLPHPVRHAVAAAMKVVSPDGWDSLDRFLP